MNLNYDAQSLTSVGKIAESDSWDSECGLKEDSAIRVLMVTPFPEIEDEIIGGVAGVAYHLCQHLKKISGLSIDVLVPDSSFVKIETRSISGINVIYLPKIDQNPLARIISSGTAKAIGDFSNRGEYDLVHIQAAPEWSRYIKQPVVTTIHGINEQDMLFRGNTLKRKVVWPLIRLSEQYKRRRIENLIVINPYVRATIGKALKGRSWDIENPVREDFFQIDRKPIPYTILFAGVVTSRKNVLRLIQAMAKVKETIPQAKLNIAGGITDMTYANDCKAEVERLGLKSNVEFLGSLDVDQMQNQLCATHVMALTSLQETAPLSIEEAMAAGVPVVSSNICGMPYMIEDGVTGTLVDPMDIDDISDGLVKTMQMDLPSVAKASINIAYKRFNGYQVAKKTVTVYLDVFHGSRGTPKRYPDLCETAAG